MSLRLFGCFGAAAEALVLLGRATALSRRSGAGSGRCGPMVVLRAEQDGSQHQRDAQGEQGAGGEGTRVLSERISPLHGNARAVRV
jgi:hypothetical protein